MTLVLHAGARAERVQQVQLHPLRFSTIRESNPLQEPRRESELMGSKPFREIENCLILVPFSVKIEFPQKLMGSRTLISKSMGLVEFMPDEALAS